jgi:hypothetical protein
MQGHILLCTAVSSRSFPLVVITAPGADLSDRLPSGEGFVSDSMASVALLVCAYQVNAYLSTPALWLLIGRPLPQAWQS